MKTIYSTFFIAILLLLMELHNGFSQANLITAGNFTNWSGNWQRTGNFYIMGASCYCSAIDYLVFCTSNNNGNGVNNGSGTGSQNLTLPANVQSGTLGFKYLITTDETTNSTPYDMLYAKIIDLSTNTTYTLATYSNVNGKKINNVYLPANACNSVTVPGQFSGYYSTVSVALPAGLCNSASSKNIRVQFSATTDGLKPSIFRIEDVSLQVQQAANPVISVTNPTAGSSWTMGNSYNVQWTSSNVSGNVRIFLQNTSGITISTIANSTTNDGDYVWSIPTTGLSAGTYKIRVESVNNNNVYDLSGTFTIALPVINGTITVNVTDVDFNTTTGVLLYSSLTNPTNCLVTIINTGQSAYLNGNSSQSFSIIGNSVNTVQVQYTGLGNSFTFRKNITGGGTVDFQIPVKLTHKAELLLDTLQSLRAEVDIFQNANALYINPSYNTNYVSSWVNNNQTVYTNHSQKQNALARSYVALWAMSEYYKQAEKSGTYTAERVNDIAKILFLVFVQLRLATPQAPQLSEYIRDAIIDILENEISIMLDNSDIQGKAGFTQAVGVITDLVKFKAGVVGAGSSTVYDLVAKKTVLQKMSNVCIGNQYVSRTQPIFNLISTNATTFANNANPPAYVPNIYTMRKLNANSDSYATDAVIANADIYNTAAGSINNFQGSALALAPYSTAIAIIAGVLVTSNVGTKGIAGYKTYKNIKTTRIRVGSAVNASFNKQIGFNSQMGTASLVSDIHYQADTFMLTLTAMKNAINNNNPNMTPFVTDWIVAARKFNKSLNFFKKNMDEKLYASNGAVMTDSVYLLNTMKLKGDYPTQTLAMALLVSSQLDSALATTLDTLNIAYNQLVQTKQQMLTEVDFLQNNLANFNASPVVWRLKSNIPEDITGNIQNGKIVFQNFGDSTVNNFTIKFNFDSNIYATVDSISRPNLLSGEKDSVSFQISSLSSYIQDTILPYTVTFYRNGQVCGGFGGSLNAKNMIATFPIEYCCFEAVVNEGENLLTWQTLAEQNASYIEVQRSNGNNNFVKVGAVPAQGNTTISQYYHFTDNNPLQNRNSYHLKFVDVDGKYCYSNVITLNNDIKESNIYPNPATESIEVSIFMPITKLVLIDGTGKIVKNLTTEWQNGNRIFSVKDLASGIYYLNFVTEKGESNSQKVSIQR